MAANLGIGKTGVVLFSGAALAMCLLNFIFRPVEIIPNEYGLTLPSPDLWQIPPFVSWIINTLLIGIIALTAYLVNRSYNFIRTTEPALPAIFLVMATSSPWFTQSLNTSTLLCLVNIIAIGVIFGAYDARNATQQLFTLGVATGIGSMFQYAFLPMAGVYFLWALFMKILRVKEVLAFIIGILCPYWIALGLGWMHFSDFHFPSLQPLFGVARDHSDILFLLASIGIAVIMGVLTVLSNSMKLYAGNSKINAMNLCVSTMGLAAVICILVDYENIPAYVLTLYLAVAVQMANICALWHPRQAWIVSALPALIYIALFIGNLLS